MIRIADYTKQPDWLKNFRPEDVQREFDQICIRLFGATEDDIRSADYKRMTMFGDLYKKVNPDYCRSLGYDLMIRDRVRVTCAEQFAIMIVAQNEGLLPKTGEERLQRRREEEAALSACRREEEAAWRSAVTKRKSLERSAVSKKKSPDFGSRGLRAGYDRRSLWYHRSRHWVPSGCGGLLVGPINVLPVLHATVKSRKAGLLEKRRTLAR